MAAETTSLRDRFNRFVDDHEVAWELVMGALAAAFVAVGFVGDDASPQLLPLIEILDVGLTVIFVAEFTTRLAASYDRRGYLRGHWIDLLALVPTARGARLLRLLRLLRLVRTFASVYRALTHFERIAKHRGLVWLFVAWLSVAAICSAALYVAEVNVNENIVEPLDALWWGVVTLTTVGYGDVYPQTPEGRLAAAALMLLGITLFAAITGTITSFLVATDKESAPLPDAAQTLRDLFTLHEEGIVTSDEYSAKKAEILARM